MSENVIRITIIDEITGIEGHGTVVMQEQDQDIPELTWLYCISDNPEMNENFEPKLNMMIWRVIESHSIYYRIEE